MIYFYIYLAGAVLNAGTFFGRFAAYSGSSYSVNIGPVKRVAKKIVKRMKDNFWVDRYTRALFTEINIYNANTNLLLTTTFLHEILPTGGWNYYHNVQSLRLYRYVGGLGNTVLLFDLLFITVTLVGIYKAIRACRRSGVLAYLSNLWNLLHVIVTGSALCAIMLSMARMLFVQWKIEQYTSQPELFHSFGDILQLEYLIVAMLGFVLFFTTLEFLRILRFNRIIALLSRSMAILGGPLGSFAMTFMVIFMAFVSMAHFVFVDKLEEYRSLMESIIAMTKMFMGQFDMEALKVNAPTFGPLIFMSFMISIQMIMINLFIGLICDAFAEVGGEEPSAEDEPPSMMSFMASQVKSMTGGGMIVNCSSAQYLSGFFLFVFLFFVFWDS